MGALRLIFGLVVAVVVVSYGVLNMNQVSLKYFIIKTTEPYYIIKESEPFPFFIILVGIFFLGFMAAWLGGVFDRLRFHSRLRNHRRQIRVLEKALDSEKHKSGRFLPASVATGSNGEAARSLPASARPESAPSSEPSPGSSASREEGRNVSLD